MMRTPGRQILCGALVGVASVFAFAGIGSAASTIISASGASAWTPNTATLNPGESVTFKNSTGFQHGINWTGGPATPGCAAAVPTGGSASTSNWEGDCTFNDAGNYTFNCPIHTNMTGTITVTGPQKPGVTTGTATAIGDNGATLNGTVDPNEQSTTYLFKWGTTTGYTGGTTSSEPAGSGPSAVPASANLTGLAAKTIYHFRLFATNSSGTSEGVDKTFTTSGPPTATTTGTTTLTDTSVTLQGTVNPFGHPTTYFFEWGEEASYGNATSAVSAGSGFTALPKTAGLTGLTPETEYHFRIVAENSLGGISVGVDKTFTTASTPPPPPPPPTETPPPSVLEPAPLVPPPAGGTAPDTRLTLKPAAKTKDRTPTFKFKSTVSGASFKCTLDGKALKPCRSPLTTKKLSFGRHTFKVGALAGGASDPTPAASSFKVLKP